MIGFPFPGRSDSLSTTLKRECFMARDLYWLSDAEWAAIQPHLPSGRRGARRVDDRRVISGIVHMLKPVLAGATARRSMAPIRRSTTASTDDPSRVFRKMFSMSCPALPGLLAPPAPTAHPSRCIARPAAQKGGLCERHRTIARRTDDQGSCPDR